MVYLQKRCDNRYIINYVFFTTNSQHHTHNMNYRLANFVGFLICAGLLSTAMYIQYMDQLVPCPLCIFQRFAFALLGILFLLASILNPVDIGRKIFIFLMLLAGGFGIAVAGRHVWLQNLPADQVPSCGPGLDYMINVFPFSETMQMVFSGSGECAEVDWVFLGLTMPSWSLIWFIILVLFASCANLHCPVKSLSSFRR